MKTSIHCFDSCILRYMRHTGVVVLLTAVHLLLSCAPKPEVTPQTPAPTTPPKTLAAPSDLTARPFYRRINLSWNTNRHESSVSSGYNIYLFSEKDSLEGVNGGFRLLTLEPYPGDTDPNLDRESYPLEGLENGTIYRAYVTTVYPDGKETPRSNIVEAIPRPESGFTLRESFKGNESGYSFRKLKSVPTDDPDNDIYLANINDALWVASPRRINVILRQTKFFSMSSYSTLEEVDLTTMGRKPESVLKIIGGLMFVLQDEEGSYALVRVESVDSKSKLAKMSFVYQSRPGTLKFR